MIPEIFIMLRGRTNRERMPFVPSYFRDTNKDPISGTKFEAVRSSDGQAGHFWRKNVRVDDLAVAVADEEREQPVQALQDVEQKRPQRPFPEVWRVKD